MKQARKPGTTSVQARRAFDFGLDRRLIKAVALLGYANPTEVQARVIPLALEGKDLLVRARTGSGKTAAYALPMLQKILAAEAPACAVGTKALVLVPTRELCVQIRDHVWAIMQYCRDVVSITALSADAGTQQAQLREHPHVVISTPGRFLRAVQMQQQHRGGNCAALASCALQRSLETLVVDEADLILSYGYSEDVRTIITRAVPKVCQCFLMSATFTDELLALEKVLLHSAVVLKLDGDCAGTALQHYVRVPPGDKPVLLYALLKLGIVRGKAVVFVNSVDRCYRVKLLLEQFCVPAAVLNAELPQLSRDHIIDQFNRGLVKYLIATDDAKPQRHGARQHTGNSSTGCVARTGVGCDANGCRVDARGLVGVASTESGRGADGSTDFGVQRGVDFKNVDTVVNYDFPDSVEAYMHRIGRTARGGAVGTALSLVTHRDGVHRTHRRAKRSVGCGNGEDEIVLAQVQRHQSSLAPPGPHLHSAAAFVPRAHGTESGAGLEQPSLLDIDIRELDGFRYRVEDVQRAVTTVAVRDARLREIKMEMVNSKKLREHFHEHPHDLQTLRHDAHLQPSNVQPHLASIPPYLYPSSLSSLSTGPSGTKTTEGGNRNKKRHRSALCTNGRAPVTSGKRPQQNLNAVPGPARTEGGAPHAARVLAAVPKSGVCPNRERPRKRRATKQVKQTLAGSIW